MNLTIMSTDGTARSTGRLMYGVVEKHYLDLAPYAHHSLLSIYNLIKNLPYRPDPKGLETLMRPYFTMNGLGYGGDCDDKSIALASYMRLMNIPFRFVAVRRPDRDQIHHVYPEFSQTAQSLTNKYSWIPADPTYRFNVFGHSRPYAEKIVLERN